MRQLLKLDGIEAEGEGKVQRKMEVCILYFCFLTIHYLAFRTKIMHKESDGWNYD